MRHSKYRYFSKREWGEAFMEGDVRFKSLSYYHQIEDGAVRVMATKVRSSCSQKVACR
jgi:hypothetical protein